MTDRSTPPPLRAVRIMAKCPICEKAGTVEYRPFCSKRCANIDLGRWLKEGYRVETDETPAEDEGGGTGSGSTSQTG
ncbi:DNA gyrase inhibitor YacG [Reyranella sp.]|uniref:DNA gyrase inhibitor YacG n=1 Tax=Reyranella sp. TaxID=1929291 RepID=UPI00341BB1B6